MKYLAPVWYSHIKNLLTKHYEIVEMSGWTIKKTTAHTLHPQCPLVPTPNNRTPHSHTTPYGSLVWVPLVCWMVGLLKKSRSWRSNAMDLSYPCQKLPQPWQCLIKVVVNQDSPLDKAFVYKPLYLAKGVLLKTEPRSDSHDNGDAN